MDLVEFLQARLYEDEAWALACLKQVVPEVWRLGVVYGTVIAGEDAVTVAYGRSSELAEHIARHGPGRVLRDVQAKRRIVEVAVAQQKIATIYPPEHAEATAVRAEIILCLLAAPYADHEDYRTEWRP